MNSVFETSFNVDKESKKIVVEREFAAQKSLVWKAWTTSEILDQWWAPKPYKAMTKSMDFSVGGTWHYCMVSPEGEKHWCRDDYQSITPEQNFTALDAFCDEDGNLNPDFPRMLWNLSFQDKGDTTIVNATISYDTVENLEKILEMGFKQGFEMGLANLDEVLEKLK